MSARSGILAVIGLFLGSCVTTEHSTPAFQPRPGDLLFQDIDCGPLCDAIETVTQGVDGARFSHVGMVTTDDAGVLFVIEAVSAGVVETPLDQFLDRSRDTQGNPKVLVGRLKPAYRHLIPEAIAHAREKLGRPYDHVFAMEDDAYYCSELLYASFHTANGAPIFDLNPMTFKDPATNETFAPWAAYYADLGVPIPEGEPGLNPGGMSMSPTLDIIHAYGRPDGSRGAR